MRDLRFKHSDVLPDSISKSGTDILCVVRAVIHHSVFKVLRGIYPSLLNRTFSRKKRNTFLKKTEKIFETLLRSSSNRKMGKKIRSTVPKDDEPIKKERAYLGV